MTEQQNQQIEILEVGDIVYLNSGSPNLTVSKITTNSDYTRIEAAWMLEGKLTFAVFPRKCLTKKLPSFKHNFINGE